MTPAENEDRRRTPDEHICFPLAQEPRSAHRRSTRQSVSKLDGTVTVSALMIDMIQEPVDISVPTCFAGAKISTGNTSDDDLFANEEVVADSKFWDSFVGGPTTMPLNIAGSNVYLARDVTVGVAPQVDLAVWRPR